MRWPDLTAAPGPNIPLLEVSGLACAAGGSAVFAVGDQAPMLAVAELTGDELGPWRTEDLREYAGRTRWGKGEQIEAIAADGGSLLVVVQEQPARAIVLDRAARASRCVIGLAAGDLGGHAGGWGEGSAGEGVVLLANGHLLLVKEKGPALVIEFGPRGQAPAGFGPGRWLGRSQSWPAPVADTEFVPLATWRVPDTAGELLADLSDAAVTADGRLLLTSDQSAAIAVVGPGQPEAGELDIIGGGFLPGIKGKLEGVAVLPAGTVLLATDRQKVKANCYTLVDPGPPAPR
ncbi:MAG: hypothetical protein ACOYEV_05425 [Candidatus Nanopelagicales bacterium]